MDRDYPVVDLEMHFETQLLLDCLKKNEGYPKFDSEKGLGYWEDSWVPNAKTGIHEQLLDLGDSRVALMDKSGIDFAQLALASPGSGFFDVETQKAIATDANNTAKAAMDRYPDRFGAYMTLAQLDVEWSLKEIDRALEMGLWGWHTQSNFGPNGYLDDPRYWPILKRCEELGMPIYIRPAVTPAKELRAFGICLAASSFGFGVDAQFCFLRLIHRGVFDEFRRLKIMLGHFGECLPFTLDRINVAYRRGYGMPAPEIGTTYSHEPSFYVKQNLWTTSCGNYQPEAMFCTRDAMGLDRVMLASDYPYDKMWLGPNMMLENVDLPEHQRRMFVFENAQKLGFAKNL